MDVEAPVTDLSGRVALVTGASRGIGAATARELAAAGMRVALMARNAGRLQALRAEIEADGGTALALPADIADAGSVAAAVAETEQALGAIDLVVNSAGLLEPIARLADIEPGDWARVIAVNLSGLQALLHAVIARMAPRGAGTVIHISSGAALRPMEGWSHYCASKAGAKMLIACADLEYREAGLRLFGLSPGTVATDMQAAIRESGLNPVSRLPWDRHIPPQWVARAVCWLYRHGDERWLGEDFSLKTDEGRALVGLPPVAAGR